MATTITKGPIGEQDFHRWDGKTSKTFTRTTSTGYSETLYDVGPEVDALMSYGGGRNYTNATITSALAGIGTTNKVCLILRPGTWTISANVDWSTYTNVKLKPLPGALISHGAFTISLPGCDFGLQQIFSGTGAITFQQGTVNEIRPEWWGGTGDNSTNNYAAIQAALTVLTSLPGGKVVIGDGIWRFGTGLTWDANDTALECRGSLLYTGSTSAEAALLLGNTTTHTRRYSGNIKLTRTNVAGDANQAGNWALLQTGVKIRNVYASNLRIATAQDGQFGFYVGLQLGGYGASSSARRGCCYNHIYLESMYNNRVGCLLENENYDGWVNQNNIYGGNFGRNTSCESAITTGTYGIKVSPKGFVEPDGNTFYSPSLETNFEYLFYNSGPHNTLIAPRFEGDSTYTTYQIFNDIRGDYLNYIAGYWPAAAVPSRGFNDATNTMIKTGSRAETSLPYGRKIFAVSTITTTTDYGLTSGAFMDGDMLYHYDATANTFSLKACTQAGCYHTVANTMSDTTGDVPAPVISASATVSFSQTDNSINDSGGGFTVTAIAAGSKITCSGCSTTPTDYSNNNDIFTVVSATASKIVVLERVTTMAAAAGGSSVTILPNTITGMSATEVAKCYVGEYVTVSGGLPSATDSYKIIDKPTTTSITLATAATSASNNVTTAHVAPTWVTMMRVPGVSALVYHATTCAIDMDLSLAFSVTLGGDFKINNPSNMTVGQKFSIAITCDGSGRTISYGTYYAATTTSITASKKVVLEFLVTSSTTIWQVGTPLENT